MVRGLVVALCLVVIVTVLFIIVYCAEPTAEVAPAEEPIVEVTTEVAVSEETQAATEETEAVTEVTEEETEEATEAVVAYSEQDLEYLAIVIYQEAGGDDFSDETRLMVGTVVMNRVADPRFPNDLHGVLTQERQYGLLHWTGVKWADRASKPEEEHAVKRAYKCAEQILMGYRSFGEDVIFQAEFVQGSEIVAYQDGMYFCR